MRQGASAMAARWPGCWGRWVVSGAAGVPENQRQCKGSGVLNSYEVKYIVRPASADYKMNKKQNKIK